MAETTLVPNGSIQATDVEVRWTVPRLPTGTVTFLFTDIEGSTRLLERLGPRYAQVLDDYRRLLRDSLQANGGTEVDTQGDALFVVFESAVAAVRGAADAQRSLEEHAWPDGLAVRARMGLHSGEALLSGEGYVGMDVHRAARIMAAGHGGQVLLSASTRSLVEDALPPDISLRDLGLYALKDLAHPERLCHLVVEGLRADFPALRADPERLTNLPVEVSSFVGRQREIASVKRLLIEARLLTLVGPGGIGKTRLALQVGTDQLADYSDGAYVVPLAAIGEPSLVPSAIAQALTLSVSQDEPVLATVESFVRTKHLLLILDNFEHLMEAAPVVTTLLAAAPRLKVLVTSRAPLRVRGEQEFEVPPLRLPKPETAASLHGLLDADSVSLFIQRARAAKPTFEVTTTIASAAVAEICVRLDGLPLGIELAAARMKLFTPSEMLVRLERRLPILTGGPRDLPARQQTLRGTIDWSYDLLNTSEQALFRRLAVFVGGFTVGAAEAVLGQSVDASMFEGVASLLDKSLLISQLQTDEARFSMLETIREYARDRLEDAGEAPDFYRRHAEFFRDLAEEAEPNLTGASQEAWLMRLDLEHDNIRASLRWAIEAGEAEIGLRTGGAVWRYWHLHGHLQEGRGWFAELLALPSSESAATIKGHLGAGSLAYWQGDFEQAEMRYREALTLAQRLGDRKSIADALYDLGYVSALSGRVEEARRLFLQSRDAYSSMGDRHSAAYGLMGVALVAQLGGDSDCLDVMEECLATMAALEEDWGLANTSGLAGREYLARGNQKRAHSLFVQALGLHSKANDVSGIAMDLDDLGAIAALHGDPERALRLSGAADRLRENLGGRAPINLVKLPDVRAMVRAKVD